MWLQCLFSRNKSNVFLIHCPLSYARLQDDLKDKRICPGLPPYVCPKQLNELWLNVALPVSVAARSKAARLLRSWVRIPLGAWMFLCCECFVLSGRGLCDEFITRPEASYLMWCVAVYYRNLVNEKRNINQL